MKKRTILFAAVGVLVVALAAVGLVYAQEQNPPASDEVFSSGECDGTGPHGFGLFGKGPEGEEGVLHDYMIASLADALDLSVDELEARLADGERIFEIAQSLGYDDEEEIRTLILDAKQAAVEAGLADGAISQEQADFMLERIEMIRAGESGPGFGGGFGHGPRGGGPKGAGPGS